MKQPLSSKDAFTFELVKSVLATDLWIWLVLDAQFGPWQYRYPNHDPKLIQDWKTARLQRAFLSLILLLYVCYVDFTSLLTHSYSAFFYPTLLYSVYAWRTEPTPSSAEEAEADESTPLLE
jgi:hypothetical protein